MIIWSGLAVGEEQVKLMKSSSINYDSDESCRNTEVVLE